MRTESLGQFHDMENSKLEILHRNGVNLESLTDFCLKVRRIAEMSWTKNTSLEKTVELQGKKVGRFSLEGQCIPTVLLLKEKLKETFPSLKIQMVMGTTTRETTNREKCVHHSWLEIIFESENDPFIIDITADQSNVSEQDAPKIIIGFKGQLEKKGMNYSFVREETSEKLETVGGLKGFEIFKKRYEKIAHNESFYNELFSQNLYIIGPVASGKTELMSGLQNVFPQKSIDVGKLFRVAAYLIINDSENNPINPNLGKLAEQEEIDRIVGSLYKKTELLESGLLKKTKIVQKDGADQIYFEGVDVNNKLDDKVINKLVPIIARSPEVRDIIGKYINEFAERKGGIILTGHSLEGIDTTKYKVIHLNASIDVASNRLAGRLKEENLDHQQAKNFVEQRNRADKTEQTYKIIKQIPNVSIIETDKLTEDQVRFRVIRGIVRTTRDKYRLGQQKEKGGLERSDYKWAINPLLSSIKILGKEIFQDISIKYQNEGPTESEIAVQTIMNLSEKEPTEVWHGDQMKVNDIVNLIRIGETDNAVRLFEGYLESGEIILNQEAVKIEAERQAVRLSKIHKKN